jgi:hypothetical protein
VTGAIRVESSKREAGYVDVVHSTTVPRETDVRTSSSTEDG